MVILNQINTDFTTYGFVNEIDICDNLLLYKASLIEQKNMILMFLGQGQFYEMVKITYIHELIKE